jgi:NAD(P)-dependent dehydrogenase (short-subunit alcohol dehydrogenase family)
MTTLLITGGSQGIGAAIAVMGAARGWAVCISYSSNGAAAEGVVDTITQLGGKAIAVHADAADEAATIRLFDAAAALGPITGVVINAGITGPVSTIAAMDTEALDRVMAINVRGAYLTLREAARRMETGGIVAIGSRASGLGGPGEWVHYAASKGAVDSMTIGAAKELAPRGIRVNAVQPGLIETEIHAKAGMPDRVERMAPSVPMGRAGTADDVARVVLWLLSDESAYVTGALIPVSGGR